MEKLTLNLGSFNRCVDHLSNRQLAEYPVGFHTDPSRTNCSKLFFYMHDNGSFVSVDLSDDTVVVPTFNIGAFVDIGKISNEKIVQQLLSKIELEIFSMIKRVLAENNIELNLENIVIPICEIKIFNDDKSDGCYGWVNIGIGVFV